MRGAIPALLYYILMAWCLVEHRYNFTFYGHKPSRNQWVFSKVVKQRMQWNRHVTRKGKQGMYTEFWLENLLYRVHFEHQKGNGKRTVS